jgi:hypothetical protein
MIAPAKGGVYARRVGNHAGPSGATNRESFENAGKMGKQTRPKTGHFRTLSDIDRRFLIRLSSARRRNWR